MSAFDNCPVKKFKVYATDAALQGALYGSAPATVFFAWAKHHLFAERRVLNMLKRRGLKPTCAWSEEVVA